MALTQSWQPLASLRPYVSPEYTPAARPACQTKTGLISFDMYILFLSGDEQLQSPCEILLVLNTHPTGRPPCRPFLPAQIEQVKVSGQATTASLLLFFPLVSLTTTSSDFWPSSPLMLEKWLLLPPLGSSPAESPERPAQQQRCWLPPHSPSWSLEAYSPRRNGSYPTQAAGEPRASCYLRR